ncbi:MAG: alpha/beta fold hydrolase, partial [Acidimicrobiales bacterium]
MALMRTEAAEIHYEIEGPEHAPVVVLSNSLGTTMDVWDRQLPALRRHLRVLRYDQRGHGGSAAIPGPYSIDGLGRDVVDLLDGLGIESASFCGLSLGASVGMWLAASAPDRVDRLVLCCGAPWLGPAQPWVDRAAAVRSRGVEVLVPMLPARWFTAGFVEREAAVVAEVVAMLSRVDAEGYAGCCEAIA